VCSVWALSSDPLPPPRASDLSVCRVAGSAGTSFCRESTFADPLPFLCATLFINMFYYSLLVRIYIDILNHILRSTNVAHIQSTQLRYE
jgi:hypothetical protein